MSNYDSYASSLSIINWNTLLSSDDINTNFSTVISSVNTFYNAHFPLDTKFISTIRLNNPLITSTVLNSVRFKSKLLKNYKEGTVTNNVCKQYRIT